MNSTPSFLNRSIGKDELTLKNEIVAAGTGKPNDQIAAEVLREYGIRPENITVIQSGGIKTVWKLRASGRQLCLKRLRQTIDKARFSVNAQIYVKNSGGLVPGVVPNLKGQPITEYEGQLFVLYEWIDGNDISFGNPADLKKAVQGLARFHIASKGYKPPADSRVSTKLGRWPEQYTSMKNKLTAWKETAASRSAQPACSAYLKHTDAMIRLADSALAQISASGYDALTAEGSDAIVLCHQDYGKGNALSASNGIYIIDLDGVTFDLPARDLRKIIGKQAENHGQWRSETITNILDWYSQVNPQSRAEREVLLTDLLYPHWYYGLVKNQFQNEKPLRAADIERIARLEESKVQILSTLFKRE
jgi:spore coat protein I